MGLTKSPLKLNYNCSTNAKKLGVTPVITMAFKNGIDENDLL